MLVLRSRPSEDPLVRLGNHPEVGVCLDCVAADCT